MARLLLRLGGLILIGAVLYMAIWESFRGGADNSLVRTLLIAGGLCLVGGVLARLAGRATAGIVARGCPRCGRRVARGRVYCEDHLAETINEYRDEQRRRDG
jgi:hypothetical protein